MSSMKVWDLFGGMLQHDFCPWANRYVYWLKRPIGWVVIALAASLLLGFYVSNQAFLGSAAIVTLGTVGCLWPWISTFGLRGSLIWSELRCRENEDVQTILSLTNFWPWPVWGVVVEMDSELSGDVPISLSRVPGMCKSEFAWKCRPASRGVFPKGKIRLRTAFPFGIWTSYRELVVEQSLIVWPQTVGLVNVPEHSENSRLGHGQASQQMGDEGEWMGVRPYRPGDSLRQVHWQQTARRESLVVFERQLHHQQAVYLDLALSSSDCSSHDETEWAVRTMATLVCHFLSHGWKVHARIEGPWEEIGGSMSARRECMDRLAKWSPADRIANGNPKRNSGFSICIGSVKGESQDLLSGSTWLLMSSREGVPKQCFQPSNAIVLNTSDSPAAQLQHHWKHMCQGRKRVGCLS